MRIEKDFKEFIELLNGNKVKYLVVGGFAIAYHATARFTKDIDIFVEASEENGKKIINTLKSFGFRDIGLTERDFQKADQIVQLGYPPLRIDIMTSISGVEFENAWENKVEGKYGTVPCFFISSDDLIKNKQASGRPQDIADIKILEKI
ncbi:MAG TPA: nucleotidyl transferase AbiEii/AbiGii toxin family protein [Candidatus Kapabacteria bacterium]|nr:nucleotidyl transferase AbiEii/AbiGii toxin family protein [Candidatus Kapabacteria bacterium]